MPGMNQTIQNFKRNNLFLFSDVKISWSYTYNARTCISVPLGSLGCPL